MQVAASCDQFSDHLSPRKVCLVRFIVVSMTTVTKVNDGCTAETGGIFLGNQERSLSIGDRKRYLQLDVYRCAHGDVYGEMCTTKSAHREKCLPRKSGGRFYPNAKKR